MLSIIIPYYKLTFFEATLQSLACQSAKRFKVYIGDDASPENPSILLEKYKEQFDFVYHRFDANLGGTSLTQQWERCIALSGNEDWIMILGDDDVLGNNVVEEFYKNIEIVEKQSINLIRFSSQIMNSVGENISEIYYNPKSENSVDSYIKHLKGISRSSLSEYIFKRESYTKYGFCNYPLAWHADDKAWLDFSNCGEIYSINNALVFIRLFEGSISGNKGNIEFKKEAKFLFFRDVISSKWECLNRLQKRVFVIEFGKLIIGDKKYSKKSLFLVLRKFISIGALKPCAKFLKNLCFHYR
jgi:hypothetical protein